MRELGGAVVQGRRQCRRTRRLRRENVDGEREWGEEEADDLEAADRAAQGCQTKPERRKTSLIEQEARDEGAHARPQSDALQRRR